MAFRLPTRANLRRAGGQLASRAIVANPASARRGIVYEPHKLPEKATLPDLSYDYGALEPYISGQIMELHHKKHHQTYVNGMNSALDVLVPAQAKGETDEPAARNAQRLLDFHYGGHINHTLFWENLAPTSQSGGGGGEPGGTLKKSIDRDFGSFSGLRSKMNTALAGIQGSGWAWLVEDTNGKLSIETFANQTPVGPTLVPLMGIDAWEHAYYLQYQNRKAEYFDAIWNVVNWNTVAKRSKKNV